MRTPQREQHRLGWTGYYMTAADFSKIERWMDRVPWQHEIGPDEKAWRGDKVDAEGIVIHKRRQVIDVQRSIRWQRYLFE